MLAVRSEISNPVIPRPPTPTVGTSVLAQPPSADSSASAISASRLRSTIPRRLGLPHSSSPSRNSFTFTGRLPCTARNAATVSTAIMVEPFTSEAPRAYSRPSTSVGSNGGVRHSSTGSAGCTS